MAGGRAAKGWRRVAQPRGEFRAYQEGSFKPVLRSARARAGCPASTIRRGRCGSTWSAHVLPHLPRSHSATLRGLPYPRGRLGACRTRARSPYRQGRSSHFISGTAKHDPRFCILQVEQPTEARQLPPPGNDMGRLMRRLCRRRARRKRRRISRSLTPRDQAGASDAQLASFISRPTSLVGSASGRGVCLPTVPASQLAM